MWDLTVPGDHDFYVLAGGAPVLVHNVNLDCVTDVALGAQDQGLAEFASGRFTTFLGNTMKNFGDIWENLVMQTLKEPRIRIHVLTKGFTGGVLQSAARGMGSQIATEKEMAWLMKMVIQGKRA